MVVTPEYMTERNILLIEAQSCRAIFTVQQECVPRLRQLHHGLIHHAAGNARHPFGLNAADSIRRHQ